MARKILFVNGPSQDPSDRFFGWPTPLLYAIAPSVKAIKDGKIDLEVHPKIFDPVWYVEGKNSEQIKEEFSELVKNENISIVCATTTYDSLYPTMQLFAVAKSINPNLVTILGGPHFDEIHSTRLNEVQRGKVVDFGVAGDGEYVLKALPEAISKDRLSDLNPREISGRAFIYHGNSNHRTSGTLLDLDSLPFMPIELVDKRHDHDFEGSLEFPTIQMIAQRGCPYSCTCCSERRDLAFPNSRSIESILAEIDLRKSQGFKGIFFDDSTFGAYQSEQGGIEELLKALESTRMRFGSLNRFNHLSNRSLVELYKRAGFDYLYCSIEQLDDAVLKQMSKGQKVSQIESSLKLLQETGIKVGVSLLYGLPYETELSLRKTLDFTKKWVDKGVIVLVSESVLSYHPGTPEGLGKDLEFNRTPPNIGHPFNRFEEGQWFHPNHVDRNYLENILKMSSERFGKQTVRNRHSWYASQGYTLREM